jgi:hypothetical protein
VLGCDGLFEASEGSAVWIGKMVRKLEAQEYTAQDTAEALAKEAIDMGSGDNVRERRTRLPTRALTCQDCNEINPALHNSFANPLPPPQVSVIVVKPS